MFRYFNSKQPEKNTIMILPTKCPPNYCLFYKDMLVSCINCTIDHNHLYSIVYRVHKFTADISLSGWNAIIHAEWD